MGETRIRIDGREVGTLFLFNDECTPALLGTLALEALFLGVDPVAQRLIPVEGLYDVAIPIGLTRTTR